MMCSWKAHGETPHTSHWVFSWASVGIVSRPEIPVHLEIAWPVSAQHVAA